MASIGTYAGRPDDTSPLPVEVVSGAAGGGLTDAELRASPVAVTPDVARAAGASSASTTRVVLASDSPLPGVTKGAGAVDATTLRVVQASDGPTTAALGAVGDAAVTNPASNASIIAALKGILTQQIPPAPTVISGITTASAAAAVIADTGNLAAGSYLLEITMGFSGASAAGKHLIAEHRNAADTATNATLAMCPAGGAMGVAFARVEVLVNESIRVVVGAVAAAASEVTTACIRAHKIA